jgi:MIP family channel proteins
VKRIGEQVIAEFIGTMLFVFIGAGSVVLFGLALSSGELVALLPIALATGLGMAVLISNTGHISGGHHNPAVTISIWVAGKIDATRTVLYVVAQMAGAAAGAGILAVVLPKALWGRTHLGTPQVNTSIFGLINFSAGRAVFFEAILSFVLVYTVFATAVDEHGSFKSLRGLPIGLAIGVDILVGGYFTGAAMNPARAFGPALISGTWTNFWVYIVGPITGGILAASVYWFAFLRTRADYALEDVAADETGGQEATLKTVLASETESAVDEAVLEDIEDAQDLDDAELDAGDEDAPATAAATGVTGGTTGPASGTPTVPPGNAGTAGTTPPPPSPSDGTEGTSGT